MVYNINPFLSLFFFPDTYMEEGFRSIDRIDIGIVIDRTGNMESKHDYIRLYSANGFLCFRKNIRILLLLCIEIFLPEENLVFQWRNQSRL